MAPGDQDSVSPPAPQRDAPVPSTTKQNRSKSPTLPQGDSEHRPCRLLAPLVRTPRPTDSTLWKSEKTPHFQQLQKLSTLRSLHTNHSACASRATRTPVRANSIRSAQTVLHHSPDEDNSSPQNVRPQELCLDHAPLSIRQITLPSFLYLRGRNVQRKITSHPTSTTNSTLH